MFAKMTDTQIIEFVENLPETCIIDVIQKNTNYGGKGATLNVIAGIMGVTRERVRQVEERHSIRCAVGAGEVFWNTTQKMCTVSRKTRI